MSRYTQEQNICFIIVPHLGKQKPSQVPTRTTQRYFRWGETSWKTLRRVDRDDQARRGWSFLEGRERYGCFLKIGGFPPKSSILIGFSIIFTIHFGGKHPYFWKHPYGTYHRFIVQFVLEYTGPKPRPIFLVWVQCTWFIIFHVILSLSRWWFQIVLSFTPTWRDDWQIFFRWVLWSTLHRLY